MLQIAKYVRHSKEEIEKRRIEEKKSIRARATHTNYQRVELCRVLKQAVQQRYDAIKLTSRRTNSGGNSPRE